MQHKRTIAAALLLCCLSASAQLYIGQPIAIGGPCPPAGGTNGLPANLAHWWKGENNGNDSIGHINGTMQGSGTYATGEVGQCFDFSNGTGYLSVPANSAWNLAANDFTIELWVNFTAVDGWRLLVCNDPGGGNQDKWFYTLDSGNLEFYYHQQSDNSDHYIGQTAFSPTTGAWHHMAVTRSGSSWVFYVDGASFATATASDTIPNASGAALTIGNAESIGSMGGYMDEVSIYTRALSGSEILDIYNAGSSGKH